MFWYVETIAYDIVDRAESYLLPIFFTSREKAEAVVASAVRDILTEQVSRYEHTLSIWRVEPSVSSSPALESSRDVVIN